MPFPPISAGAFSFEEGGGAAGTKQKRVVKLIIMKHSANKRERARCLLHIHQPAKGAI